MSTHDTGVTELLRRASDGLAPDVDRLVSGGITRGRSRQRRARIGTTVASLAVIGVVGALAAVVPQMDGADSARDPGIATDGTSATEAPTTPADDRRRLVPRGIAGIHARRRVERERTPRHDAGRAPAGDDAVVDEPDQKFVAFAYGGMHSTVGMNSDLGPDLRLHHAARRVAPAACGGWDSRQVWGPTLADRVTFRERRSPATATTGGSSPATPPTRSRATWSPTSPS